MLIRTNDLSSQRTPALPKGRYFNAVFTGESTKILYGKQVVISGNIDSFGNSLRFWTWDSDGEVEWVAGLQDGYDYEARFIISP